MAQYLNLAGVEALWGKIKGTFALKSHTHSDYAAVSHGIHWNNFYNRALSNASWGKLTSSNGYTPIFWMDSVNGGGVAFSDYNGQTFMQIDGDYYAQEGQYKVYHEGNLTKSVITGLGIPGSDTNTWRPVTNTYTGSDQSTCVSQKGTNDLYNALVNGYASSAGSTRYIQCPDTRNDAIKPTTLTATTSGVSFDFKGNNVTGLTAAYAGVMTFRPYATGNDWTGGPAHNLAFDGNGIHHRTASSDTWGSWVTLLHTGGDQTKTGNLTANGFYQSSDERLKTFYDPIEVDLDKLKTLRKNYFKFNDKDKLEIGVSAQEVQEIYPELVTSDDEGYLSVAYDKLSIIALKAIDKLNDENNELKNRLNNLESILKEKGIL